MHLNRLVSFFAIFALIFFCSTNVWAKDEVDIADDNEPGDKATSESPSQSKDRPESTGDDDDPTRPSTLKSFQSNFLFLHPAKPTELFAGQLTRIVIGTRNNGDEEILVESIDSSIRYPLDYSFFIQNFTLLRPERVVEGGVEATFEYLFVPSETFGGRPMGFVLLLNLRDKTGRQFQNVVFNQTINFVDVDDGIDGQTVFLSLLLVGIVGLGTFLLYQYVFTAHWKRSQGRASANGKGGETKGNYDLDWIPKHHLTSSRPSTPSKREKKVRPSRAERPETTEWSPSSAGPSSENDE